MEEVEPSLEPSGDGPRPMKVFRLKRRRLRVGAAIAVAAAGGLLAWAIVGNGNDAPTPSAATTAADTVSATAVGPVGMSAQGLQKLAKSVGQPIYWAGPEPGYLYELTRTSTGKVFVRYLPPGAKVGSKQGVFLIVATYPFRNAYQGLGVASGRTLTIPGGGRAVVDASHPESVHLAYPASNVQIEVYDPSPARSLALAQSGAIRPVPKSGAIAPSTPPESGGGRG